MASSFFAVSAPELILSIACFLFFFFAFRRRSQPLMDWPVVGMLPSLLANLHHIHEWSSRMLGAHGCTFEFKGPWFTSMGALITADPANVQHIFNVNFANYPKGDNFAQIFDILGNGIFNSDHESWKLQRKKAHGLISSPRFRTFVAKCSHKMVETKLIPLLDRIAEEDAVVDLQDVFLRFTFDTTSELVFGVNPGCLSPVFPTVPFAKAIDDAMATCFLRYASPPFWWKLLRIFKLAGEKKLAEAWVTIDKFVETKIAEKGKSGGIGSDSGGEDLLTSYMNDEDGNSFSSESLRDTTVNMMLAGRDTTGSALTWFFWLLTKNPEVESKILDELKKEDSPEKVYLHAALSEALRLFPPVPFEQKGALQPDVLPSGHKVKAGRMVMVFLYAMGRMEGVWGKDCYEFKPERWISEQGRLKYEPSYKFISFNSGPRTCLGKNMAFTQMKAAAASVIRKFQVEVVRGHVVEPKASIILQMKNGLMVKIKKRELS